MRAQAGLEALVAYGLVLLVFMGAAYTASLIMDDAAQEKDSLEANSICLGAASEIGALSSSQGNASMQLSLPLEINSKNYTLYVAAANRLLKVDFNGHGVGCRLQVRNITNSSGASLFVLAKNATLRGNGGVIVVEP